MAEPEQAPDATVPVCVVQEVEIPNPQGIHARPATLIARTAAPFKSQVTLRRNDASANAKSTIQVLTLAAEQGAKVTVQACGEDAQQAVEALVALVRRGFDEM